MKYTIQQISEGEEEVILRYRERTPEVERICNFFQGEQQKLRCWREQMPRSEEHTSELQSR